MIGITHLRLTIYLMAINFLVSACGGGGGSSDNNSSNIPAEKIQVDGHLINPDFFTPGQDFYVNVSYFDPDGKLTSYHEVYEWDGTEPTFSNDYLYTYNSNGEKVLVDEEFTYTREGLALYNHVFDQTTREYTAGRLTKETNRRVQADLTGDGIYDDVIAGEVRWITNYTYDSQGNLKTVGEDSGGDSVIDTLTTYEYDSAGNPVEITVDNLPLRFQININEFDASGNKIKQTLYRSHAKFLADERDSITEFFYDDDSNLVREEIDNGVAHSSDQTPDGTPDTIIRYSYGNNSELLEKSTEEFRLSSTRKDVVKYLHEATDTDGNGEPDVSTVYVFWLDTVFDSGGGYPAEALPDWYTGAQNNLNNGNNDDGWDLDWDGHDTGTCSTCGNMVGEVTKILLGF